MAHANIQNPVGNDLRIRGGRGCATAKARVTTRALLLAPPGSQTGDMLLLSPGGTTVRNPAEDPQAARLTPGLAVHR
jgi:hypothetical protein